MKKTFVSSFVIIETHVRIEDSIETDSVKKYIIILEKDGRDIISHNTIVNKEISYLLELNTLFVITLSICQL